MRQGKSVYSESFAKREPNRKESLEIAIGAILTQNTSWKNVESALTKLKELCSGDFFAIPDIPDEKLKDAIRPSGYFNQKTRKIRELFAYIKENLNGDWMSLAKMKKNSARESLLSIWGIGPETADSILLYGFLIPIFVVDAYTRRIFSRLAHLDKDLPYDEIRLFFEKNLPQDERLYREYHALIVRHAVTYCLSKPICKECPILSDCPEGLSRLNGKIT